MDTLRACVKASSHLLLCLSLAACGHAGDKPEASEPSASIMATYDQAVARFMSDHVDERGNVFTLDADGAHDHLGESILWASVALAYLPCARAEPIAHALVKRIDDGGGFIARSDPLPKEYAGREFNFDGKTGLVFGVAAYVKRCPSRSAELAGAFAMHQHAVDSAHGELYPKSAKTVPEPFRWSERALMFHVKHSAEPDIAGLRSLETVSAVWAAGINTTHAACYRVHLAYRHLRAAEFLGYEISRSGRDAFCRSTRGMGLANIEHWCGRGDLADWIAGYQHDRYEYEFQRCRWESPDGNGDQTPGLDLIEAIAERYNLSTGEGQ